MLGKTSLAVLILWIASSPNRVDAGMIGYGIGNSLSGTLVISNRFANLSSVEGGNSLAYDYHIRPNSSLSSFIESPSLPGDLVSGMGSYKSALATNSLNFVTIQPFYGRTIRQEAHAAAGLIQELRMNPQNANTRVLIFQAWPTIQPSESYLAAWNKSGFNLDSLFEPSLEAFGLFEQELMLHGQTFDVIPVGKVFAEIARELELGTAIPGLTSVNQLYGDQIHLANNGAYLATITAYSAIYQKSPVGLPLTNDFLNPDFGTSLDPNALPFVQNVVGNIVGVPEPSSATLALAGTIVLGLVVASKSTRRKKLTNFGITA